MEHEEKAPKVVIHIDTAYNVNPSATKVENTFNIYSREEGHRAIAEAMGKHETWNMDPETNGAAVRNEILNYVNRVRPLLNDQFKSGFMKMWEDILDLPEVKKDLYKPGKQWDTNFNRDLVANIFYHLRKYRIYKVVYKDNYNGARMAEVLEGDRDHSVKHALRQDPAKDVREAVDKLLKDKYNYV